MELVEGVGRIERSEDAFVERWGRGRRTYWIEPSIDFSPEFSHPFHFLSVSQCLAPYLPLGLGLDFRHIGFFILHSPSFPFVFVLLLPLRLFSM